MADLKDLTEQQLREKLIYLNEKINRLEKINDSIQKFKESKNSSFEKTIYFSESLNKQMADIKK